MMAKVQIFDPKKIPAVARQFLTDVPLVFYQGGFYEFHGQSYGEVSPEYVTKRIVDRFSSEKVRRLDAAKKKFRYDLYNPSMCWAKGIREYISGAAVSSPPAWLTDRDLSPHEILPVRNGLLHIPSRTLLDHTRDFFVLSTSRAAFYPNVGDPLRHAPAFASMLRRVWGNDDASIYLLQEILGYLLTPDPPGEELQKMFLFRGAPRGGKGTIVKVIEALVGDGDCCQISAENIAKSSFALQPLIDHRIGMLGDLRLDENPEVGRKLFPVLLKVVGGDPVQVDRKYKPPFHARLNTRLVLESNKDLGIHDPSGALASRILPLIFTRSFAGQEDPSVPRAILEEIDFILLWALDGWDRVSQRRARREQLFKLPDASCRELEEIRRQGSAVRDFLEEFCSPDGEASLKALYSTWIKWAQERGVSPRDANWLRQEIRGAWPGVTTQATRGWGAQRDTILVGLRIVGKEKTRNKAV